ncbi:unnamed protein product [Paramecium pentaurelia]|uniref:Uncharacterized protein n=1 Tax=Paramecium pentaurelia TaxID=43138 RepID=A0A8S1YFD7_9CILI|nr:unnamed protein product [Paramecium pentaurelia]
MQQSIILVTNLLRQHLYNNLKFEDLIMIKKYLLRIHRMGWSNKIKRQSIRSAKVFHHFFTKAQKINIFSAFIWASNYENYYASLIFVQSLLLIKATRILFFMETDPISKLYLLSLWLLYLYAFHDCQLTLSLDGKVLVKVCFVYSIFSLL